MAFEQVNHPKVEHFGLVQHQVPSGIGSCLNFKVFDPAGPATNSR
jgi:hypothetical protein